MGQGKKEDAEEVKKQVNDQSARLAELEEKEAELEEKIKKIMLTIPNIIDKSVPIGRDDSENVEVKRYGEPVVPDFVSRLPDFPGQILNPTYQLFPFLLILPSLLLFS